MATRLPPSSLNDPRRHPKPKAAERRRETGARSDAGQQDVGTYRKFSYVPYASSDAIRPRGPAGGPPGQGPPGTPSVRRGPHARRGDADGRPRGQRGVSKNAPVRGFGTRRKAPKTGFPPSTHGGGKPVDNRSRPGAGRWAWHGTGDDRPQVSAAEAAHPGCFHGVIHRFSPGEQGPLCPGKFFGIMALIEWSRRYPRRSGPSVMKTVEFTLLPSKRRKGRHGAPGGGT